MKLTYDGFYKIQVIDSAPTTAIVYHCQKSYIGPFENYATSFTLKYIYELMRFFISRSSKVSRRS